MSKVIEGLVKRIEVLESRISELEQVEKVGFSLKEAQEYIDCRHIFLASGIETHNELSTRSKRVFHNNNINTLLDVLRCGEKRLLETEQLGKRTINEVKGILRAHDIELGH